MPPFKVGQRVRIGGLTSEAGLKLNGKAGVVIKLIQKTGRAEVRLWHTIIETTIASAFSSGSDELVAECDGPTKAIRLENLVSLPSSEWFDCCLLHAAADPPPPPKPRFCWHCGGVPGAPGALIAITKLRVCTGCNRAGYCSRECQSAAWATHKPVCGTAKVLEPSAAARAAAAATASSSVAPVPSGVPASCAGFRFGSASNGSPGFGHGLDSPTGPAFVFGSGGASPSSFSALD